MGLPLGSSCLSADSRPLEAETSRLAVVPEDTSAAHAFLCLINMS